MGSLGVSSGNDWDPTAAWFGLALTAFIDLAVPTFALLLAAGVETNAVFDKMFKDLNLLLPIVGSVFTIGQGPVHGPVRRWARTSPRWC